MNNSDDSNSRARLAPQSGTRHHDALTFSGHVYAWYAPHLDVLAELERTDAQAILGWQLRTLTDGEETFGVQCPTGMIVSSAGGHLQADQALSQAYCILREGVRQRDVVGRIASRLAQDDLAWEKLLKPILGDADVGTPIEDTALMILLSQHYGNAPDAVWRVLHTWHQEQFDTPPDMTRAQFDLCVA